MACFFALDSQELTNEPKISYSFGFQAIAKEMRFSACGIKNENIGTDGGGFPAAIMLRESFLPHFLFPGANVRD